jgi:O-antigen/teichoic acid export membrane protein
MTDVTKTAKYAGIYALGVFLNRAVSFIMLPIYTRFLTPRDYGTIELLTMTVDVFGMIASLGLSAAVFRFYYQYEKQHEKNQVISTISLLITLFYFLASTLGFGISDILAGKVLDGSGESIFYFKLIFITFFLQGITEISYIFIMTQQRPIFYVFVSTGKLFLQLSLNIYFVVILNMHVLGVLYSGLISSIIIGLVLTSYTYKTVGFSFSKSLAKSMIFFGAPFIISNIGDFILTFSDRYFLKAYADLTVVGIYSLGYKLGFVLWIFPVSPILNIWAPQRFEVAKKPDVQETNKKVFFFYNLVIISVALGISLFSHDLFRTMSSPSFWGAYQIVPLIMVAYIVQAWTAFGNFGVIYSGKTRYIAIGTAVASVSIILLSFILIPAFHAFGAAIATILSFIIRFFIIFYFSQREFPLFLPWGKCLIMFFTAVIVYLISLSFKQDNVIESIMVNSAFWGVYIGFLLILPLFNKREKQIIFSLILHPIRTIKLRGI